MPYALAADLQARYPDVRLAELSDPTGVAVQNARLQTALTDASAEMDSYLGRRYFFPLASVPPILTRVCCDIAIYRLQALLPKEVVADARRRFEDATTWLDDLASGRIYLPDLAGVELSSGPSVRVIFTAAPRVFGAGSFGDY